MQKRIQCEVYLRRIDKSDCKIDFCGLYVNDRLVFNITEIKQATYLLTLNPFSSAILTYKSDLYLGVFSSNIDYL